jgi:hypothetical protein
VSILIVINTIVTCHIIDLTIVTAFDYFGIIATVSIGTVNLAIPIIIEAIAAESAPCLMKLGRRCHSLNRWAVLSALSGAATIGVSAINITITIIINPIETESALIIFTSTYEEAARACFVIAISEAVFIIIESISTSLIGVLLGTTDRHPRVTSTPKVHTISEVILVVINLIITKLI